jgi:uncharacterized SAM-binding protein YcdF (DUF218 family)
LGGYDLGVATLAAELYSQGFFPQLIFSGAVSNLTASRYPCGEAVHFREHAIALGVPSNAILLETRATNTGENIAFSRRLLSAARVSVDSVLLITKPYMERRAFATARLLWPEVEVTCASPDQSYASYAAMLRNRRLLLNILVGSIQRILTYPALGYCEEQHVPLQVRYAAIRLDGDGFIGL